MKQANKITGAEIVIKALIEQGVDTVFGYPGGAILPIYDELFQQKKIKHILVRHEQAATHAAEGYARSTGKIGVVFVTSGPGATNSVTGLTDALMDSVPIVVISGQVPTFMIGNDAFQEADTVGITRPCTKHNWLVKDTEKLAATIHKAFEVAGGGRPGPVLVDVPKDVQFASGHYTKKKDVDTTFIKKEPAIDLNMLDEVIDRLELAERPIVYSGGGVINSGQSAVHSLRNLVAGTNFPITSTLLGLGSYPASGKNWLGMLGMHGTYEANMSMHGCDFMLCVGARFDDRITGRIDAFSPDSYKVHIDIDPSSVNKNITVDAPLIGDVSNVLNSLNKRWKERGSKVNQKKLSAWWQSINDWKKVKSLSYESSSNVIKPQYAIERLEELTKPYNRFVSTEVGQHQMWAAQFMGFEEPNRWMTSGGLGTMGYGFPASIGIQIAHPKSLVINVAGEASWLMNMQELGTAVQYRLPVKQFILNNERLGMVRQWQELLHGERYSHSWSDALPDFVKLAEAYGIKGIRCESPDKLDDSIREMIEYPGPVIFDCLVEKHENCFPMIPSGKAHNEMILGEQTEENSISDDGAVLV
ncbi:MAG: acetolactate synthase 3 large subunit [Paracoccaceae bacterium]|nr:MAG: acetolactate synthase 3 large subunit [Alphaproteobacteria bacterium]